MTAPRSAAQLYALVAGIVLIALGVLALIFGSRDFGELGTTVSGEEMWIFATSAWGSVIWIATGVIGVLAAANPESARMYATLMAVFYAALAVWGFVGDDAPFWLFDANRADNVLHAIVAGAGLLAALPPPGASWRRHAPHREAGTMT